MNNLRPLILAVVLCFSQTSCSSDDPRYLNQLSFTQTMIYTGTYLPSQMMDLFSSAWASSIRNGLDASAGIARMKAAIRPDPKGTDWFAQLEADRKQAADLMVKLSSPPAKYQEAHTKLVEMYGTYERLCDLASNPRGTYQSYQAEYAELRSKIEEENAQVKALLPKSGG